MKLFNNFSKIFISGERIDTFAVRDGIKISQELKGKYLIVSLPDKYFYVKIFHFPLNLSAEQVDESIRLNVSLTLPLPIDDIYVDWQKINSLKPTQQEFLLVLARKSDIDSYLKNFNDIGAHVVAMEPQMLSLVRGLSLTDENPVLILNLDGENLSSGIVENKMLRFLRNTKFDKADVDNETHRLVNFYNTEAENNKSIKKFFPAEEARIEMLNSGMAKRAGISRAEDIIISLMPIGTEEAYANKKVLVFSEFLSSLIIGLSLFFLLIFSGASFFLYFLNRNVDENTRKLGPQSAEVTKLEITARDFNERVDLINELISANPRWSKLIQEIKKLNIPGIIYNRFDAPSIGQVLTLQGSASNQQALLQLKSLLENSSVFGDVKIPISTLTLKQNIGFSFNFILKDKNFLYEY